MACFFEDLEVWKKSCGRKRKKEYSGFPEVYKYSLEKL
jgi:hypothetical protein